MLCGVAGAGEEAGEQGGETPPPPSREELDQLARENRSLREALTAMAVKGSGGETASQHGPPLLVTVSPEEGGA